MTPQRLRRRNARTADPAATPSAVKPATRAASIAPRPPGAWLTEPIALPPRYTPMTSMKGACTPKACRLAASASAYVPVTPIEPPKRSSARRGWGPTPLSARYASRPGLTIRSRNSVTTTRNATTATKSSSPRRPLQAACLLPGPRRIRSRARRRCPIVDHHVGAA
jgi:hypothetical protein